MFAKALALMVKFTGGGALPSEIEATVGNALQGNIGYQRLAG